MDGKAMTVEDGSKNENGFGLKVEETFSEDITPSRCLKTILRPLTFSMTISGMLYDNGTSNRKWSVVRIYSVFMILVQWGNFLRIFSGIILGNFNEIAFSVIIGVSSLQCCLNITLLHVTNPSLGQCFKLWDEHFISEALQSRSEILRKTKYAKIFSISLTITGWIFQALNIGFLLYSWLGPLESSKEMIHRIMSPFPRNDAFVALALVLHFMTLLNWIFPIIYMLVLCLVLCQQFDMLRERLQNSISKSNGGLPPNFEHCRKQHIQMTKLIQILDKQFKYLICICYVTNIPIACFLCYQVAKKQMDAYMLFLHLFWLAIYTANVILPSLWASVVHEKAHNPAEDLYDLSIKKLDATDVGKLELFLGRLNGGPVGFTVWNLLIVNKELLLTLGGLFLTYLIVILTFNF